MEIKDIITLIDAVSKADIMNFHIEEDGFSLSMDKLTERVYVKDETASTTDMEEQINEAVMDSEDVQNQTEEQEDENTVIVKSPIVGTYYGAPGPDQNAYVEVGNPVKKGQVLCIIEAMKLMNDIESDYEGTVVDILVKDGQNVEYGQPLFKIKLA